MKAKKNSVYRVNRGGSFMYDVSWVLSVPFRGGNGPKDRLGDEGFRLVIRRKA